jgi:hypothetical protein
MKVTISGLRPGQWVVVEGLTEGEQVVVERVEEGAGAGIEALPDTDEPLLRDPAPQGPPPHAEIGLTRQRDAEAERPVEVVKPAAPRGPVRTWRDGSAIGASVELQLPDATPGLGRAGTLRASACPSGEVTFNLSWFAVGTGRLAGESFVDVEWCDEPHNRVKAWLPKLAAAIVAERAAIAREAASPPPPPAAPEPQGAAHEPTEASPTAPPAAVPEAPASAASTSEPLLVNHLEVDQGGSIPATLVCPRGAIFEVGRLMTVEIVRIEEPGDGAAGLVRAHVVPPRDPEGSARRSVLTAIGHLASAACAAADKSHEERMRVVAAAAEAFALMTAERPSTASRDALAEVAQLVREYAKHLTETKGLEIDFFLSGRADGLAKLANCLR